MPIANILESSWGNQIRPRISIVQVGHLPEHCSGLDSCTWTLAPGSLHRLLFSTRARAKSNDPVRDAGNEATSLQRLLHGLMEVPWLPIGLGSGNWRREGGE